MDQIAGDQEKEKEAEFLNKPKSQDQNRERGEKTEEQTVILKYSRARGKR